MRLRMLALALCLLLLSGCGADQFGMTVVTTGANGAGSEDAAIPEDSGAPEDPGGPDSDSKPDSELKPVNLFETIPHSYMFCSGTGGWSTDLTLEPDGSFTGLFLDADMGDADLEKFPEGTYYVCEFSGKFTQPERVDDTTWSMEIESLELKHPAVKSEEYADGRRYIYSDPYGLENAEEILVYLPDTPADSVPEDVLWAARGPYDWKPTEEGTLGLHIIFNVSGGHGFAQYPLEQE